MEEETMKKQKCRSDNQITSTNIHTGNEKTNTERAPPGRQSPLLGTWMENKDGEMIQRSNKN
jgi:hypothetical protein